MIERGWEPATLDAMEEAEFGYWYEEAIALEEAKAAAIEAAGNKPNPTKKGRKPKRD